MEVEGPAFSSMCHPYSAGLGPEVVASVAKVLDKAERNAFVGEQKVAVGALFKGERLF